LEKQIYNIYTVLHFLKVCIISSSTSRDGVIAG